MRAGISPKDFADAIGVSESSVKRWVDQGTLKAARTAGGHRRIAREEALRFVREQHGQLVRPDKLGLEPGVVDLRSTPLALAAEQLYGYLTSGREGEARGVIAGLFLGSHGVAAIADEVIRPAMERIGKLWIEGLGGVYIEHRATDICQRAIDELRVMMRSDRGPPSAVEHVAVVAGPARDPYLLAPALASLTLNDVGWTATNLGPDTPIAVLELAARELGARLVVLSVSAPPDRPLRREVGELITSCVSQGRLVAIGGQCAAALELGPRADLFNGKTLSDLAGYATRVRMEGAPPDRAGLRR